MEPLSPFVTLYWDGKGKRTQDEVSSPAPEEDPQGTRDTRGGGVEGQ